MSEIDTRALAQVLVGTADEEIVRLEARLRAAWQRSLFRQ